MNTFAKSILNYFATYTETRFRFQSKSSYKWTNDHLTCDFPVFPEFQKKLLDTIKAKSQIDFSVRKCEYTVVLDGNEFKERLIRQLEDQYNLEYIKTCFEEARKEQGDASSENNSEQTASIDEQILPNALRKFNLTFRNVIRDVLLTLQEEKKKDLSHYIKDSVIPHTTFNPNVIEQSIYDSFRESASKSKNRESFYKKIMDIISHSTWNLEMYDLYSMIRKFTATLNQTMGTAYIFFHEIYSTQDEMMQRFPLFLIELNIEEHPEIVRIRSERGVIFINTPAINSFHFDSVLTIPRAARFVEAPDYLFGVEKFIQNSYDFFNTFLLERGFDPLVAPDKPRITFRVGFQNVLKEDRKLLDYSELITRIDAGRGGKFKDFIKNYVSGNVHNTTDEVDTEYKKKYPPKTAASILSTIPLSLNKTQKRILTALESSKNEIIVIDGRQAQVSLIPLWPWRTGQTSTINRWLLPPIRKPQLTYWTG